MNWFAWDVGAMGIFFIAFKLFCFSSSPATAFSFSSSCFFPPKSFVFYHFYHFFQPFYIFLPTYNFEPLFLIFYLPFSKLAQLLFFPLLSLYSLLCLLLLNFFDLIPTALDFSTMLLSVHLQDVQIGCKILSTSP